VRESHLTNCTSALVCGSRSAAGNRARGGATEVVRAAVALDEPEDTSRKVERARLAADGNAFHSIAAIVICSGVRELEVSLVSSTTEGLAVGFLPREALYRCGVPQIERSLITDTMMRNHAVLCGTCHRR